MGQLVPFPAKLQSSPSPRVAQGLAGDVPVWRAVAECRTNGRIRTITCTLVQPEPGRLELLRSVVGGEVVPVCRRDPSQPDEEWGEVAAALVGLWVDVPMSDHTGLHLVTVHAVIQGMSVEAALTMESRGVRGIMWTAKTPDGEVFGRIDALLT